MEKKLVCPFLTNRVFDEVWKVLSIGILFQSCLALQQPSKNLAQSFGKQYMKILLEVLKQIPFKIHIAEDKLSVFLNKFKLKHPIPKSIYVAIYSYGLNISSITLFSHSLFLCQSAIFFALVERAEISIFLSTSASF